jgi:hypothetical protein
VAWAPELEGGKDERVGPHVAQGAGKGEVDRGAVGDVVSVATELEGVVGVGGEVRRHHIDFNGGFGGGRRRRLVLVGRWDRGLGKAACGDGRHEG